ncbi:FMRFamide receptor [Plakobranchus ocellatus]|uniref:FMRFamide receptor n=1 Tax=Plakobranchus ocellatus TaxID=259542 RepID=A0AAV4BZC9_9GAST|nr:FMRFamide receptor [Plakobranchus ocellatus]
MSASYMNSLRQLGVNMTQSFGEITPIVLQSPTTTTVALDHGHNMAVEAVSSSMATSTIPPVASSSQSSLGERVKFLNLIMLGILGCSLAVLGLLGNCLSMMVLQRPKMRSSTSYFLLSLAVYDNLILLGMLAYFCIPSLVPYTPGFGDYHSVMSLTIVAGYPLSLAAQMGSIYTCVGFTVERYIAVCRPLHVANTCTKSRTIRVILLIFFWSILYNIPRFFHYEIYYRTGGAKNSGVDKLALVNETLNEIGSRCLNCCKDIFFRNATEIVCLQENLNTSIAGTAQLHSTKDLYNLAQIKSNTTVTTTTASILLDSLFRTTTPNPTQIATFDINNMSPGLSATSSANPVSTPPLPTGTTVISYRESDFGSNATFKHIYLIYSHLFFMFLIPFVAILVMNIGLIRAVKGSLSAQRSMCASARKEHNLTVMLIAVIVVFLVCQFPTIVDNILVAVVGEKSLKANFTYWCFYTTCTLMVLINAASNFLLYCLFGKKFRMILLAILGCKPHQRQVAYRSTVSKSRTNGVNRTYDMEVSML